MNWSVVQKKAIQDDGSLLFPERLTKEFLDQARRTMGSYWFANQYMNEIIPDDARVFKKEWFKYFTTLPQTKLNTFAFIDPAISQNEGACFTGITVIKVDCDDNWFIPYAARKKLTPTQIIDSLFALQAQFQCRTIGVETIAYQEALLYMLDTEMRKRGVILPVVGIKHGSDERKETRIQALMPRFEWGRVFLKPGLVELEDELLSFPRGAYVDILDSLASMEKIYVRPEREVKKDERPNPADSQAYESWYRRQLHKKAASSSDEDSSD